MTISNRTKTKSTYHEVISSVHFQMGYTDYRLGVAPQYDKYRVLREQSRYERGRLFAAACTLEGEVLCVNKEAVSLLERAVELKEVV
jgi:hypothetical protein